MPRIIYVINASSRADTGITADLAISLDWARAPGLPEIRCITLEDGPNGISSQRDSDDAAPAVLRFIERETRDPASAGFVIACFSDPGVTAARELTRKPVIGIGEAGYFAALSMADRIGTIGVSADTAKSRRTARILGIGERVTQHISLGLDYGQLKDPAVVTERLIEAGQRLSAGGAEAILLAGAGLARYVAPLQAATGVNVVDPTQAACGITLAQVLQMTYSQG